MGWDYALVHLKYTIPPAIALTCLYRPLFTKSDLYKITFLVVIALVSTTPWDSYLIHNRIWTYPPDAVIGLTLFRIPLEEYFFFVIQTYNTCLLYLFLSKPTFHPIYIRSESRDDQEGYSEAQWKVIKHGGQAVLALLIWWGSRLVSRGGEGTYLGLILVWAVPFLLLLWSLAYQFVVGLPLSNTALPIFLPTLYLWIVDTLALKRGTWVIESGTKLAFHLWDGLEIEEAVFFLITNVLVVFGLIAFDNAMAVIEAFPSLYPNCPPLPSPLMLATALLVPTSSYDKQRIPALQQAVQRLRKKSRSFYLASGVFEGRLRIDLVLLYAFCRVADDLVDDASSVTEAKDWIRKLEEFLDMRYLRSKRSNGFEDVVAYVNTAFPEEVRAALVQLPTQHLTPTPLYDLLRGFDMDLKFSEREQDKASSWPIRDESNLMLYGSRVAGTVAELCLDLVFHYHPGATSVEAQRRLIQAGGRMGIALQYVNIARDITVDATMGRVYIPGTWLKEEGWSANDVIAEPQSPTIERLRSRLLDRAFSIYEEAREAIEALPPEARASMRVAVESYMEIGRVLREGRYKQKAGRATVPKIRRIATAWNALNQR